MPFVSGEEIPPPGLQYTFEKDRQLIALLVGITIFDITDLSHVRYCFVDFHGMESERAVQLMTPLTARTYLEAYCDLGNARDLLSLLDEFNGWDTIPVATLQDTWPEGEWEEPESDEVVVPELEKRGIDITDTSKSLRDGAMASVLQALLNGSDDSSGLLSEAEVLTDFLPKLKGKLYEQAEALKPSHHLLDLLHRALEDDIDVDLSPFVCFSAEDLSHLVSRLRKHGKMNTLCISNRPDLSEEDLRVVLRGAAGLKSLFILEDPQIPVSALLNDCDLYHSDLLRQPFKPQSRRSYTRILSGSSDNAIPASRFYGDNDVSQLVWIGITHRQACDKRHRLETGTIDWKTLSQDKSRDGYDVFGLSDLDLKYKRYSLDIPLPTLKTVAGLLRLLKWTSSSNMYSTKQFSMGSAFSFAMASSISGSKESGIAPVGRGNGFGIGPLGSTLYVDSTYGRTSPSDADEHLEPGQWAVVLIHEACNARNQSDLDELNADLPFRAIKRLRYALVTPSTESNVSDRDFISADIPTFLRHTMGKSQGTGNDEDSQKLIEVWNDRIALIDDVDFYGDDDIHDFLPKVFPGQKAASSGSKPE